MFQDRSAWIADNPAQRHYGVAVIDVDGDGSFEFVIAGFGQPNAVLKWQEGQLVNTADPVLQDPRRRAIGIAGGDLDGDGREEIYILNTDTFGGTKRYGDRLFDWHGDQWLDLFEAKENFGAANLYAGRSVACIDRLGSGRYGFFVASYGGPMALYEQGDGGPLVNVAAEIGVALDTGGRGVICLPLVSDWLDIFVTNEGGANYLFEALGDGTFEEVGQQFGLGDMYENGRGVAALDGDGDGHFNLVAGNWQGPHRLFVRTLEGDFVDAAPRSMAAPTQLRTVITADFDNDGWEEIFFNNIDQPNGLYGYRDGTWTVLPSGEAAEPHGLGTGAAVCDVDGDGRLELLIAHGEQADQPLSIYQPDATNNNWLRVLPRTQHGAPARGAVVTLRAGDRRQVRCIDGGSGYLCQMEPVAHFGLGQATTVEQVDIRWPGGAEASLVGPEINQQIEVTYPGRSAT